MTSHAAVVARGMGKCCVSGAGGVKVDYKARTMNIDGITYKEGDWISLNGSTGEVYADKIPTIDPELSGDFGELMDLCDKHTKMLVRTNADTPKDAEVARNFGAQGIGLTRTEHMFFEGDRIKAIREMILSKDLEGRTGALAKILPYQREDFEGIFEANERTSLSRFVSWILLCMNSYLTNLKTRQKWLKKWALRLKKSKQRSNLLKNSTPCWDIVVAVWVTPIRKLPKCRLARSSKPR